MSHSDERSRSEEISPVPDRRSVARRRDQSEGLGEGGETSAQGGLTLTAFLSSSTFLVGAWG